MYEVDGGYTQRIKMELRPQKPITIVIIPTKTVRTCWIFAMFTYLYQPIATTTKVDPRAAAS